MKKWVVDVYRWSSIKAEWVLCYSNCPQEYAFFEFRMGAVLLKQCGLIHWKEVANA